MTMFSVSLLMGLSCCSSAMAQEKGRWQPLSTTARGVTGGMAFSDEKLTINFVKFPLAEIRDLTPAELQAIAPPDSLAKAGVATGHLYRLSIPATQQLLNRNTMCGGDETQWLATSVRGKSLQVAFFSGAQIPVMTSEALTTATTLCGTFSYVR